MKTLMKQKPAISKRRLLIIFILCTILTVSVMTGFSSGLNTDNTVYTPADGMRIVTWADAPDGATPENSDALSSLRYTAQNIYLSTYFRGDTRGNCIADIGMGMEYNQDISNTRVINGNVMFQEAISISSLKKVANQRYIEKDTILYRPSTSISGTTPNYPDQVIHWTKDEYRAAYGAFPNELSKYVITADTLLAIRDENGAATVKNAANAPAVDGESDEEADENDPNAGEVTIDVPQALVKGSDGNYTFTVTLDPEKASKYYRNEVKSLGDLNGYPEFRAVEQTITIDENFFPVSITTVEKYKISLPVIGTPTCTAVLTETFSKINEPDEVPEQDFFRTQFDAEDDVIDQSKSPSDYLLGTFQPYLDGEAELKLAANISVGGVAINNVRLAADLKTMNIKASIDSGLYVEYAGDRVYLTLNNIKGYLTPEKAAALMNDERIAGLLGGLTLPDFNSYIDKDILTTVLGGCEITPEGDLTRIHMPFSLGEGNGKIDVDANIYITEDGDKMTLERIVGNVKYGALEIYINASTVDKVRFPAVDSSYECLDNIFDLVPEILGVALEPRYGISGSFRFNDMSIGVDAYVDRTDVNNIKAKATLNYNGISPVVTYADGSLYVELGNIKLKARPDEIFELAKYVSELTEFEIDPKLLETVKSLLPSTVTDFINMVFDLSVTDDGLKLGLKRMAVPIDIALSVNNGALGLEFGINTDKFGIALDAGASLTVSGAEETDVTPIGEYVNISALSPVIDGAYAIATSKKLSANIVFNTDGTEIAAKLAVDFTNAQDLKLKLELINADYPVIITVIGKTAYIELDTNKYSGALSGSLDDITALLELLDGYIPENVKPIISSVLDGSFMQNVDIVSYIGTALDAVTSVTESNGTLTAIISYNDISVTADIATDLSALTAHVVFGETDLTVTLDGIVANANVSAPADTARFVKASDLIAVATPMIPLIGKSVYGIHIDAALLGTDVDGDIAVSLKNGKLAASATVRISDLTAKIFYENDGLYLTVENTIAVRIGTTQDEIYALLAKLETALPDIDFEPIEQAVNIMFDLKLLLDAKLSILPCENGIKLAADLTPVDLDATLDVVLQISNGVFEGVGISGKAFGNDLGISVKSVYDLGALTGFEISSGDKALASLTLTDVEKVEAAPESDYIDADRFIDFIAPITDLIEQAKSAKSLRLDIFNAYFGDIKIEGTVDISLEKSELFADITLFANNENEKTDLYVTLKAGKLYINTGNIMLYFDTVKDSIRIYDVITQYIPADNYLNKEIKKLLLPQKGDGLPAGISTLTDALNSLITLGEDDSIIDVLLGGVYGMGSDSVAKILLDAVRIKSVDNELAIDVFAPFGISMRVTPIVSDGKLAQINASVSLGSMNVSLGVGLEFNADGYTAPLPDKADEYVSIADFIDAINNAVNTITAKNGNDITFEVSSFTFDYDIFEIAKVLDENGDPVLDENGNTIDATDSAGRKLPLTDEKGEKVKSQIVNVKNNGDSALKVRLIAEEKLDENGNPILDEEGNATYGYKFNLEAHVLLDIETLVNSKPLELDLYIINDNDNPDGIVYLDYYEQTSGQGERIKLDYTSIMEIIAAAMDIMSVNDDTVEMLLGDYRQPIDKSVFESMDIAGLDSIKGMLDSLADAVNQGTAALADVKDAWDLVFNAGNVVELINRRERIGEKFNSAISGLQAVIGMFASDEEEPEETEETEEQSFGELFGMIVNGISFESKQTNDADGNAVSSYLKANIDNAIATQTEGVADVIVSQSKTNGTWMLDRIEVDNLDVNTAKLNRFDMQFKAGTDVKIELTEDRFTTQGTRTYSDLSNIKHLLFDVMNTANMLEFDIGGLDTDDSINLYFVLGSKYLGELNLNVRYNAKVKIMPVGVDENGKTQYKTAAAIEIHNDKAQVKILGIGSTVVVPECTTRLYFYDNVIYIQGVKSWSLGSENVKKTGTGIFGNQKYDTETVLNAEFVDVAYTVDELGYMLSNDMNKFLEEFVFYLIPLTEGKVLGVIDIRKIIRDQIGNPSSDSDTSKKTVANIFKGYTYENGTHSLTIGLAELASSTSLSDLHLSIVGANDSDDNLLDNYIASLHVDTKLVSMLSVNLDATLRNTSTPTKYYVDDEFTTPAEDGIVTEYKRNELESTGLGTIFINEDRALFTYNGQKYVRVDGYTGNDFVIDNGNVRALDEGERVYYTIEDIVNKLLAEATFDMNGKVVSLTNRDGGIAWNRPWKEAYENSLTA